MHELSIAQDIIETIEEQISSQNIHKVHDVEISIGTMSGVIPDTLLFSWEIATKNTKLENSELKINQIQAQAQCKDCNYIFNIEDVLTICPKCNSMNYEIIKGKELKINNINVE